MAELVVPALIVGGTAAATIYTSGKQTKAAKSEAKKTRLQQEEQFGRQLEAGEYYAELSKEQMELQSQMSNIRTLANLLEAKGQPKAPQVFTLPEAKTYTPAEQINRAIDQFIRG